MKKQNQRKERGETFLLGKHTCRFSSNDEFKKVLPEVLEKSRPVLDYLKDK